MYIIYDRNVFIKMVKITSILSQISSDVYKMKGMLNTFLVYDLYCIEALYIIPLVRKIFQTYKKISLLFPIMLTIQT